MQAEDINQPALDSLFVSPTTVLIDAVARIDANSKGIVLVVDEQRHLIATLTDGDFRRAMLAGVRIESPVSVVLDQKKTKSSPVSAPAETNPDVLLQVMREHSVRQIPLIDGAGRVVGLSTMEELLPSQPVKIQAVVMAGGYGTRLRPLTDELPKPMLPVGGKPLMELIITQLREAGIRHVNVTTHYRPEKIKEHFGNGASFGVDLNYVDEDRPLGTAGALGLITLADEPVLVINGDILTQVSFRALHAYHQEHDAELTIGVRRYDINVPYGVVECDGPVVHRVSEKPQYSFFVNAGIYLLQPEVCRMIQPGERTDMTDVIQTVLGRGMRVVSFPIREYWLDIGQHSDYARAQQDALAR